MPLVIVARPCLGTINHTLLTISAIKGRKLKIAGVVFNYAKKEWKKGLAERTAPEAIASASGVPLLGTVRYGEKNFAEIIGNLTIARGLCRD